jgi:hypothetical protein
MRRGGEGGERAGGAGRKRRGWWAGRGLRTWAERPNAGPHVGGKKNIGPVFLKKKNTEPGIPCVFPYLALNHLYYTTCAIAHTLH